MEIKKIDPQSFIKPNPNCEPKAKPTSSSHKWRDTIVPTPKKDDLYDVDLNITLSPKTGPKKVTTDHGCNQTQTCNSTCSGCSQTDSGCRQTQRDC